MYGNLLNATGLLAAKDPWENLSVNNRNSGSLIQRDRAKTWENIKDKAKGISEVGFNLNAEYRLFTPTTGKSWPIPVHTKEDRRWLVDDGWCSEDGRTVAVYRWEEMPMRCPILKNIFTHQEYSLTVYKFPGIECANIPITFNSRLPYNGQEIQEGSKSHCTLGWALSPDGKRLAIHFGSKNDNNGEIRIYTW